MGLEEAFPMGMEEELEEIYIKLIPERDQQDRWEEDWSLPTSVERREEGILIRQESPHRTPPTSTPSEDKFFTNWSSAGSPHMRMPPQSVLVAETEPTNQPVNQTIQPGLEPTQIVMRDGLQNDITVSSRTC